MLKIAKQKIKREGLKINLHKGNIQTIRLDKKFDAVISMFNVMGYQITNEAFEKALLTARTHLKKGGLFVFDVWFGPAVLKDNPKDRKKVVCITAEEKIIRYSKCRTDMMNQVVEINFITEKHFKRKLITINKECHRIHFFFPNEIRILLKKSGFTIRKTCPFLKLGRHVTESDWNIAVVSEKAKP
jgi:SAM-dependent methyltransferase